MLYVAVGSEVADGTRVGVLALVGASEGDDMGADVETCVTVSINDGTIVAAGEAGSLQHGQPKAR